MSIIAVRVEKDYIHIGADSILVRAWTQQKNRSKIEEIAPGFIIAGTGYIRDVSLLHLFARNHTPQSADEYGILSFVKEFSSWQRSVTGASDQVESNFIIVYGGKAFTVASYDVHEVEVGQYAADGAGRDYALAALHLGEPVKLAIKVACELSVYCEEPIKVYSTAREETR